MTSTPELKPGDRVRYIGTADWFSPDDKLTGTVVHLYEGFNPYDVRRTLPYPRGWHASVQVDKVPSKWPYPQTDKFAPAVDELELINEASP